MKINFQFSKIVMTLNDVHSSITADLARAMKDLDKRIEMELKEANAIERDIAKQCGYGTVYPIFASGWSYNASAPIVRVQWTFIAPPGYRDPTSHYHKHGYITKDEAIRLAKDAMNTWLNKSNVSSGCASFKDDLKKLMKKHNISTL